MLEGTKGLPELGATLGTFAGRNGLGGCGGGPGRYGGTVVVDDEYGCWFPKIGGFYPPKMDGLYIILKTLMNKWMIWRFSHYFWFNTHMNI